jgi:hypothetical protein
MRRWGITPIYKASRLDRGLGIRATHKLADRDKKGRCGRGRETCKECRGEETFGFKEELENENFGHRNWQRRLTRCGEIIHGDVDSNLMIHMPPGFMRITYPIGPLDCDMHHPG